MRRSPKLNNQAGFSILEMMIALIVMLIIMGVVTSIMQGSIQTANATYELTDSQQGMRIAHEFISRDLVSAGDGLRSMTYIPVSEYFVENYLTLSPVDDPSMPDEVVNLGILTTDNDVPADTVVHGLNPEEQTDPVIQVRSSPQLTDRQTILSIDSSFIAIPLAVDKIDSETYTQITIADLDAARFETGEIYFFTSSVGGTFGTVTDITNDAGANSTLTFGDDSFGLNVSGVAGRLGTISQARTQPMTLQRMKIIHYYIDMDGRLMRRVFGVKGAGFREAAIADHVTSVQFVYSLGPDGEGNNVAPVVRLSTLDQQIAVRQVEVRITTETPHPISLGLQPELSSIMSTSVRNMQFRQALQPKGPTPTPSPTN